MKISRIDSIEDKRISIFRSLKGKDYIKKGVFIGEGEKVVGYLLRSKLDLISVLITEKWLEKINSKFKGAKKSKIKVYLLDKKEMEKVVGFKLHQGIMAAAKIPKQITINKALKLYSKPCLFVAFDAIHDVENIGLIVRNCVAFGVGALIIDKRSSNPYLRRAVRVSMGAVFSLPIIMVENVAATLRMLKKQLGFSVIAASSKGRSVGLDKLNVSHNKCLVLGNEAYGLSRDILRLADNIIKIKVNFESLNVASASAIMLHHLAELRHR